jgi:hypothetical protein
VMPFSSLGSLAKENLPLCFRAGNARTGGS